MNELKTFDFQFVPIRVVLREGEPWFVAKDACTILALENVGQATAALEEDDKVVLNHGALVELGLVKRDDLEITRLALISEGGLYQLIFKSLKPEAKTFKRWITHEVLPSIRRTGTYSAEHEAERFARMSQAEVLQMAANIAAEKQVLACKVQEMAPKAAFHDAVAETTNAIPVAEVAKLLRTGENRFFRWLRDQHFLMWNNLPYQEFIDRGYFEVKEGTYHASGSGEPRSYRKTCVTGKGQVWLQKQFAGKASA